MIDFTVFYSWQNDTDVKINHFLIRDATKAALKKVAKNVEVEDAVFGFGQNAAL